CQSCCQKGEGSVGWQRPAGPSRARSRFTASDHHGLMKARGTPLPRFIVLLLCSRTHEATRALSRKAFAVPTQKVPRNSIGHHNGGHCDAWGHIEFVFLTGGKRQRDLTG